MFDAIEILPGNWGKDCLGNGEVDASTGTPSECLCDECDYLICCTSLSFCDACQINCCPRKEHLRKLQSQATQEQDA